MYTEFVIPALLCVAGLILVADFLPIEMEWNPDQNPDHEEDFASTEESLNASQTNSGAATTSAM